MLSNIPPGSSLITRYALFVSVRSQWSQNSSRGIQTKIAMYMPSAIQKGSTQYILHCAHEINGRFNSDV